jgi:nucleoside-diphosphate-sugar epimerase
VKIVKGDYDSAELLTKAASEADIVVHNGDSDHEPSLNALISGLLSRPNPGFLLHLSGTGIVSDWNDPTYLGNLNPKVWSDIEDVNAISSLPDGALHRNTEKILFDTIDKHGDKISIAIMCPPDIYGKGLGLAKNWSALVPMFITEVKKLDNRVFFYETGLNTRSWVHIQDLVQLYLKVVEAAAAGGQGATWGREGYYFAATQEISHIEVANALAAILKNNGLIENESPIQVSLDTLDSMANLPRFPKLARYLFASNSRTRADRAGELFGYKGKARKLLQVLEDDVVAEIKRK